MAVRTDRNIRSTLVGYSYGASGSGPLDPAGRLLQRFSGSGGTPPRQIWAGADPCPTDCCCHDGDLPTKGSSVLLGYKAGKAVWAGGECIYHKDGTLIPSLLVGYKGDRQVWAGSCCKPMLSGSRTGSRPGSLAGSDTGSSAGSGLSGSMSGSLSGSREYIVCSGIRIPLTLRATIVSSANEPTLVGLTALSTYNIHPWNGFVGQGRWTFLFPFANPNTYGFVPSNIQVSFSCGNYQPSYSITRGAFVTPSTALTDSAFEGGYAFRRSNVNQQGSYGLGAFTQRCLSWNADPFFARFQALEALGVFAEFVVTEP